MRKCRKSSSTIKNPFSIYTENCFVSLQSNLPIEEVLPELLSQLSNETTVLLQAPTGSGKTTRVPLALLDADWRKGRRIIMIVPRWLVARSSDPYTSTQ